MILNLYIIFLFHIFCTVFLNLDLVNKEIAKKIHKKANVVESVDSETIIKKTPHIPTEIKWTYIMILVSIFVFGFKRCKKMQP